MNFAVPLAIFKREKEIARRLEFDGLYIAEQPEENDMRVNWLIVCDRPIFFFIDLMISLLLIWIAKGLLGQISDFGKIFPG